MDSHNNYVECVYCYTECSCSDCASEQVPAVADDAAWAKLARHHDVNCEWILTRAHRVFQQFEEDEVR
jgi:hypothetical protein